MVKPHMHTTKTAFYFKHWRSCNLLLIKDRLWKVLVGTKDMRWLLWSRGRQFEKFSNFYKTIFPEIIRPAAWRWGRAFLEAMPGQSRLGSLADHLGR